MQRNVWLVLAALLSLGLFAGNAKAQDPVDIVRDAVDEVSEQLRGRRDEFANDKQALYELINGLLLPRFDRRYAAQLVLGRHWRTASETQRNQFIEAFYQTLLRRYADGVLEFDQERIEILPYRGDPTAKRTSVKTRVRLDDGTEVPVSYALVRRDSGWLFFDVTVEGISYIRNFRAEMNSEVSAKGLDAVIKRLQAEAAGEPAA